jgi:hypothetical protein
MRTQVKGDPVLLVQFADEGSHFLPQNLLHGNRPRRHHVHPEFARSKRSSHFEPDEARSDHHDLLRRLRLGHECPRVGGAAQVANVRQVASWQIEPYGLGSRGQE